LGHPAEAAEARIDLARLEELLHHAPGVGLKDLRPRQPRHDVATQSRADSGVSRMSPGLAWSSGTSSSADSASRAIKGLAHQRSRNGRPDRLMVSGHAAWVLA
jgi:hypothetical protein